MFSHIFNVTIVSMLHLCSLQAEITNSLGTSIFRIEKGITQNSEQNYQALNGVLLVWVYSILSESEMLLTFHVLHCVSVGPTACDGS